MNQSEFRTKARLACNDHAKSNWSGVINLLVHESNTVNGISKLFFLMHRRIISTSIKVYLTADTGGMTPVSGAVTYDADINAITLVDAPIIPNVPYAAYNWYLATDEEMDVIIEEAIKNMNITRAEDINDRNQRVVMTFVKALHAQFCAQHAAEYYTIAAGGKSVSKESLFSQYMTLFRTLWDQAMQLRDDFYQGQGEQYTPLQGVTGANDIDQDWST